jgi:membrane protein required for beta-lactamase induction
LIRRRAVFTAARDEDENGRIVHIRDAAEMVHGWLAWIPARLTAVGYAAAGHMDEAIAALRAPTEDHDLTTSKRNEALLARVGVAALALRDRPDESPSDRAIRGAEAANHLVFKLFLIWAVVIAVMTLTALTQ